MKIFVGNLATETVEKDLMSVFQEYGDIAHVNIAKTMASGKSRGFGFVDVAREKEGREAIVHLNGTSLHGQKIRVSQAHRKDGTR